MSYLCSYFYRGSRWSFEIQAESWSEAQERILAMRSATVDGQSVTKIEARWIERVRAWLKGRRGC